MPELKCVCPKCGGDLEYVQGENYGADADGNRGRWIPGYYVCTECGRDFDVEDNKPTKEPE